MSRKLSSPPEPSLRPLLPRPRVRHSAPVPSELFPRRSAVPAACNSCRKYKAKCSGERPACRRCTRHRLPCVYAAQPGETQAQARSRKYRDIQDRVTSRDELFSILKDSPYHEALEILQRIRSGADLGTVLAHLKAGDALLQMAVSPESRYRYEFPYRKEMPEQYVANNPYLDSFVYEAASLYSANRALACEEPVSQPLPADLYLKPFHAAQVVEPQLSDTDISWWTAVCNDNALMRDLIGALFLCEYQFTAAFQKDLFLQDMAAQRTEFCSSLLVNTVLAYCCVCYPKLANRAEYWNPQTPLYGFFSEAKRLWELEASEPRITTIQAGILLSVIHNLCGIDEIGKAYRIHTVAMAYQLRLFNDHKAGGDSERSQKGRAFLAWTLYNWETLTAFSFMHVPLINTPPTWSLPDPSKEPGWYGEIWARYPASQHLVSLSFCHVFHARCHFRVIMNDFCTAAFSKDSQLTLDDAYGFWTRLNLWYGGLKEPLLPRNIVLPGQLQIHIYYYHLLLTMFEPLVDAKTSTKPPAQEIVADAKKYLQTLVRLYYLRHGFEAMDLFIVIPLMLTGYECVDAIDGTSDDDAVPGPELEALRSTLILIVQGLYSQRRNHYLAEALYRVMRGRMRAQEAALLRTVVDLDADEADGRQRMEQAVRSHWPVSVVKNKDHVDSHILTNLVEAYANMSTEERAAEAGAATAPESGAD